MLYENEKKLPLGVVRVQRDDIRRWMDRGRFNIGCPISEAVARHFGGFASADIGGIYHAGVRYRINWRQRMFIMAVDCLPKWLSWAIPRVKVSLRSRR